MDNNLEERRYFEDFLEITGWGLYHNFIIGLVCVCSFVRAVTFVTLPLAVAFSSCDKNYIPESFAIRMFTSYYVGTALGGLLANFLSDRYGRKKYLTYSLLLIFMSSFTAAFAYNGYVIIGAAFFLGVGLETNSVSAKLLVLEVLPREKRGFYSTFCDLFWLLGFVSTSLLVIMFKTPSLLDTTKAQNLNMATWRVMFAVCGGANLLLACACALIEESPRYFLQAGRSYLAYLVLKQMYAINNSSFAEYFKVKEEDIKNIISHHDLIYLEPISSCEILKKLNWRFYKSLDMIFSKPFCRTTFILILMKIFVIVFGLLQLNIVLAKQLTFSRFLNVSYDKYRGLDFVYPVLKPISYMTKAEAEEYPNICSANQYNANFYRYFLVLSSAMVLGLVLTMFLVDRLGRTSIICFLLSSCSFLNMTFMENIVVQIISTCTVMASMSGVSFTISLVTFEAFPTVIRGTSYAATNFIGLFLAAFFINFIVIDRHIFAIIMAVFYSCISVFTFFLPELKRMPMVE